MKRITSFTVDHDVLEKGMYVSRIDGDIVTYDLRFVKPNTPPFLENAALHSLEHLFATYARNSKYADNVVYFGPMGCRTGFYLIVRDLSNKDTIELVKETLKKGIDHEGVLPGAERKECGNYLDHDVEGAKKLMSDYLDVVKDWTIFDVRYKN